MTAWVAARACTTAPARYLDLGCGIGSVLLMTAWRFPQASCVGIEAQEVSFELAKRSLRYNGVEGRVEVRRGDFRSEPLEPSYDLVTGTPPYFPPGTGTESSKVQAAPARFEHRGGVEAYCEAMARALRAGGVAVLCAGAGQAERMRAQRTLHVASELIIEPKRGRAPLLSVYVLRREPSAQVSERLVVRENNGQWSEAFRTLRAEMGLPPLE